MESVLRSKLFFVGIKHGNKEVKAYHDLHARYRDGMQVIRQRCYMS